MSGRDLLPKKIWIYWDKGWENAPELVKRCRESWRHYNPDWEIISLDADNLLDYFDIYDWMPSSDSWVRGSFYPLKSHLHSLFHSTDLIKDRYVRVQAQSDIIRINLLRKYGGVWVDATLWCAKPLETWLIPMQKGFFCFSKESEPASVSSWFLAAHKDNDIVEAWQKAVTMYWFVNQEAGEYYWFHGTFKKLYNSHEWFRLDWNGVQKIDNTIGEPYGPHYFAPYSEEKLSVFDDEFREMIDSGISPVFKLSNQKKKPLDEYNSIKYLFNSIGD